MFCLKRPKRNVVRFFKIFDAFYNYFPSAHWFVLAMYFIDNSKPFLNI